MKTLHFLQAGVKALLSMVGEGVKWALDRTDPGRKKGKKGESAGWGRCGRLHPWLRKRGMIRRRKVKNKSSNVINILSEKERTWALQLQNKCELIRPLEIFYITLALPCLNVLQGSFSVCVCACCCMCVFPWFRKGHSHCQRPQSICVSLFMLSHIFVSCFLLLCGVCLLLWWCFFHRYAYINDSKNIIMSLHIFSVCAGKNAGQLCRSWRASWRSN